MVLGNNTVYGVLIDEDGNPWQVQIKEFQKFDLKLMNLEI